jgi:hypothetical protein
VLFVHNLDEKPREVTFSVGLPGETGRLLINLLSENHSKADKRGRHTLLVEGYGYHWYRIGGLDYLLKRSDIDTKTPAQRRSSDMTGDAQNDAFIRAQFERALHLLAAPVEEGR